MFLLLPLFFVLLVNSGIAKETGLSEESQGCLGCHGKKGITASFENNEFVEAYVDAEKFKASIHNSLTCSDCHIDFSADKHPERRFRSKEQYTIQLSRVCRRCHTQEQIKAKSIHARLFSEEEEGRSHPCTNCHGSHSIIRVGKRMFKNEEQYCLKCHGNGVEMEFKNGEILSLGIDISLLNDSVHNKLSCSDCHFGFSSEEHPQRNFRSRREYTLASSENCRRCHFDKYTKTLESIHFSVLSQGNLRAPVCIDCHGSHSISHFGKERISIARRCQRCHSEVYNVYTKSVHGNALINESNQDVPICIDCHRVHDIQNPLTLEYHERIPEMCGNCHADKAIMGKYGLSTDVVKTYLTDFHGVTLSFYKMQRETLTKPARPIAVCTDCHGTHNITSTRGTSAAILKANMVKRCRQCHKDATKNFPDAWLSHYEPSLKKAQLVFVINRAYDILMPVMVIGLLLQIILHIWRYAINR
ncbi:MAG: cytochrome c3 family protein [Nitrospirae bacterium]|nr:cytochrome c3 family protein [Nitrospirota bacterium]